MRAVLPAIVLSIVATAVQAQSLQVTGHAGVLGEWALTATVTATTAGRGKEFSGPLTMKHIGMCTQDGPEEKSGEMRFQMSGPSRIKATLVVDGAECTYNGRLSDSFTGMMACPHKRAVPLMLWVR